MHKNDVHGSLMCWPVRFAHLQVQICFTFFNSGFRPYGISTTKKTQVVSSYPSRRPASPAAPFLSPISPPTAAAPFFYAAPTQLPHAGRRHPLTAAGSPPGTLQAVGAARSLRAVVAAERKPGSPTLGSARSVAALTHALTPPHRLEGATGDHSAPAPEPRAKSDTTGDPEVSNRRCPSRSLEAPPSGRRMHQESRTASSSGSTISMC